MSKSKQKGWIPQPNDKYFLRWTVFETLYLMKCIRSKDPLLFKPSPADDQQPPSKHKTNLATVLTLPQSLPNQGQRVLSEEEKKLVVKNNQEDPITLQKRAVAYLRWIVHQNPVLVAEIQKLRPLSEKTESSWWELTKPMLIAMHPSSSFNEDKIDKPVACSEQG